MNGKAFSESLKTVFFVIDGIDETNPDATGISLREFEIGGKDVKDKMPDWEFDSDELPSEIAECVDNHSDEDEFYVAANARMHDNGEFAWQAAHEWSEKHGGEEMPPLVHFLVYCSAETNVVFLNEIAKNCPELVKKAGIDTSGLPEFLAARIPDNETLEIWRETEKMRAAASDASENDDELREAYDAATDFAEREAELGRFVGFAVSGQRGNVEIYATYADEQDALDTKDLVARVDMDTFMNLEKFRTAFGAAWASYTHGLSSLAMPEQAQAAAPRP